MEELINRIFSIKNSNEFETVALDVFKFQYENNEVYGSWCRLMG
ncbi:MAG TPA: acyl transferase, partial [Bacteroidales bacterium]|nr:acyl transferase [Bacteroidales bacterium]